MIESGNAAELLLLKKSKHFNHAVQGLGFRRRPQSFQQSQILGQQDKYWVLVMPITQPW